MKRLLLLAAMAAVGLGLAGCEVGYTERQQAYVPDYGYTYGHHYSSQMDYYRHYNGIDG
jgi:hypothetical protein